MTQPSAPSRSVLGVLFVTVFVDLLGFGIVLPLLPYYARTFHASGLAVGALIAVYSAMQVVFAPLWGRWSDRVGRRPVLLVSLAGSTASYLLFTLADGIGLLFVSRILAGVAGANIPVAQAFIADSTTDEDRARGMGLIGAAFGLGFVFGPAIGGLLAHYGHRAPGLAATVICGLNLLVALWRLPESFVPGRQRVAAVHPLRGLRHLRAGSSLTAWLSLFAMAVFSFATMETTLSLLCASAFAMPAAQIYWLFGFMGVMTVLMQGGLVGRLSRRIAEPRLAIAGPLLLAVGLAATPFMSPGVGLLAALTAVSFGQGIASPVLASLISKSGGGAKRGEVLGVSQSLGSLARVVGPVWGGLLFDYAGGRGTYLTTAALLAGAAAMATQHGVTTAAPDETATT